MGEHEAGNSDAGVRTDAELLVAVVGNDWPAFTELYGRHGRAVFLYGLAIVRSAHDAEDVAQDAWRTFWTSRARISLSTTSLLPWLLVTTRHLALKKSAARVRAGELPLWDDVVLTNDDDVAVQVEKSQLMAYIAGLVSDLNPIDQRIYELCLTEGLSYRAAATQLDLTETVIRGRLFRLRQVLRTAIANNGGR